MEKLIMENRDVQAAFDKMPEAGREKVSQWVHPKDTVMAVLKNHEAYHVISVDDQGRHSMITVWQMFNSRDWSVSADVQSRTAVAVYAYLQRRMS